MPGHFTSLMFWCLYFWQMDIWIFRLLYVWNIWFCSYIYSHLDFWSLAEGITFTAGWHAFKALILSLLHHCVLIRVSKNHDQKTRVFVVVVVVNFLFVYHFCFFVCLHFLSVFILEDVNTGTQTVQESKGRRFCRSQRGSGYRLLPLACSAFLIEIRTASSWMAPSSTRLGSPSSITNWENVL